jgi:hypothetical protein
VPLHTGVRLRQLRRRVVAGCVGVVGADQPAGSWRYARQPP